MKNGYIQSRGRISYKGLEEGKLTGLVTSCLGKIEGRIEMTGRQGRRRKQVHWMTLRNEMILELDRGSTK
jgi:hypothetical protein